MKKLFVVLLIQLVVLLTAIAAFAGQAPLVLVLNSYHHSYTWSDRELAGVEETIAKAGLKVDLREEFMDSKNYPKNEHFEQLRGLFAVKYGVRKPALVITLDNPAFEFAIRYRPTLFKGVPIVFAGLNDYEPAILNGESGIAGIVEKQDIAGTVRLARQLQPDLKEVVCLHDFTSSGLASRKEAEEQLFSFAGSLKITYLPDMTIDEVLATVKGLPPGTAVLPFSYSRDKAGRIFTHSQLTELLAASSAVPVYGTKEERLGFGIIGGSLLEGKSHGAAGAELAVRLLRGEPVTNLSIITDPVCRLMFDYRQLKKYGIDRKRLPAGSILINEPPNFYRQHYLVINVAGAIILLLTCSMTVIIAMNRRRIRAEAALLEAERGRTTVLAAANREMESFCYAVSHDLQAPLRHIQSYCAIIEEERLAEAEPVLVGYLQRIKGATERMSRLIADLLMLSKSAMAEISPQEFDLSELAREVFAGLGRAGVTDRVEFDLQGGMRAVADRSLLRTVLEHLLDNACKFSVNADPPRISFSAGGDGGRQVFRISDNGVGFDAQYAEKLFAPFQRLHPDTEFSGNGIGLAIVQRIIHRHGGQIWAESRPGQGATFCFTLHS